MALSATMSGNLHAAFAVLFLLAFISIGCKLMPGWRQLSEAESQRFERIANEKINDSVSFRALSDLCEKQIPLYSSLIYSSLIYTSKSASWKGSDYLSYFYVSEKNSKTDWQNVKSFYKDYFLKEGWKLTSEVDAGWGASELEHRNDKFLIRIYYKGLGEADFAFHCANLPELDENGNPRH